ncbi:unnamed protein product [Peronospora destructor]|uniref:Uncharacterized protein n=1 Tax=Peronospora destructor TaxID=86335 RepID=A0AAV0SZL6_9STRA|nr:unnamed protein product [Peronospora destructor]
MLVLVNWEKTNLLGDIDEVTSNRECDGDGRTSLWSSDFRGWRGYRQKEWLEEMGLRQEEMGLRQKELGLQQEELKEGQQRQSHLQELGLQQKEGQQCQPLGVGVLAFEAVPPLPPSSGAQLM